jgi:hypothetical protein
MDLEYLVFLEDLEHLDHPEHPEHLENLGNYLLVPVILVFLGFLGFLVVLEHLAFLEHLEYHLYPNRMDLPSISLDLQPLSPTHKIHYHLLWLIFRKDYFQSKKYQLTDHQEMVQFDLNQYIGIYHW